MPLFTTPAQFLALALVLVAGWLLGLATHPGGKAWRNRYAAEREANAEARRAADERHAADAARIAELEREHARRAGPAPVAATTAARPALAGDARGWFDWEPRG